MKLSTNDAATTNSCLIAAEEEDCANRHEPGSRYRFHFHSHCMGHQAVLLTKPPAKLCGDLATIVVRLGHVLSGSTQMKKFCTALDQEIESNYDHVEVLSLPADAARCQQHAAWIMQASLVAFDLSKEDADRIARFFNYNWRVRGKYTHLCVAGACPFGCRTRDDGLAHAKTTARLALGMGTVIGLEYRWKGMERSCAFALRGRGMHDVLYFTLARMWTKQALADAEREASHGAGAQSWAVANAIRAGSILRHIRADPKNRYLVKLHLATHAVQLYLNEVMKVDDAVSALVTADPSDPAGIVELKSRSVQLNHRFLSGANGKAVVKAFSDSIADLRLAI